MHKILLSVAFALVPVSAFAQANIQDTIAVLQDALKSTEVTVGNLYGSNVLLQAQLKAANKEIARLRDQLKKGDGGKSPKKPDNVPKP